MFRKSDTHIHFVGIGGIGMSGIAEVLVNLGYRVTGTDLASSDSTRHLQSCGAVVHQGHSAAHLGDADVVVISSAVRPDNPEVQAALGRKIPVIPRAEMLAELMRLKQGIVIAGSHGKTTTTSMVAQALHAADLDPTVVIGGKVNAFASNARLGRGPILVAEADESDGSFLVLTPTLAVITNIDAEHLDHYGSEAALLDAFVGFANRVPFYGMAVVCIDSPNVRGILPRLSKRVVTYGFSEDADYVASDLVFDGLTTRFNVRARGTDQGTFEIGMPGRHNVLNALAAIAICDEQEVPGATTRSVLAEFAGVQRRFTVRGEVDGVLLVDDYAHHPTEIQATLDGAKASFPHRRIVAVVQPHRYTRLRDHLDAFVECLAAPDEVWVTPVHRAGETPIPGVDSAALVSRLRSARQDADTVHLHDGELGDLPAALRPRLRPGDLVLTMGAGSITHLAPALLEALES